MHSVVDHMIQDPSGFKLNLCSSDPLQLEIYFTLIFDFGGSGLTWDLNNFVTHLKLLSDALQTLFFCHNHHFFEYLLMLTWSAPLFDLHPEIYKGEILFSNIVIDESQYHLHPPLHIPYLASNRGKIKEVFGASNYTIFRKTSDCKQRKKCTESTCIILVS